MKVLSQHAFFSRCKIFIFLGFQLISFGCATASKNTSPLVPDKSSLSDPLASVSTILEENLRIQRVPRISNELERIAHRFAEEGSKVENPQIFLILTKSTYWENYSVPKRIYLSLPLVKEVVFENELAALIAIELSHLKFGHLYKICQTLDSTVSSSKTWEDVREKFHYPLEFQREAIQEATGLLYRTGYDPRGIVSLYRLYKQNMKYSKYTLEMVDEMITAAQTEVASYPPLRNPIVRSNGFIQLRRRIQSL